MKKLVLVMTPLLALALSSNAQFQMGAQMSTLQGHGKNDNHATLVGATVTGTYTVTDNLSVGAVMHVYSPKKTNYQNGNIAFSATDDVTNISTSVELAVTKLGTVGELFVGADAGISLSNHNVEYKNDLGITATSKLSQTYMMISPKVGISIALSGGFGIYSQVQYNYAPGNGGISEVQFSNGKNTTTLTTEPISKYINFDTGIYFKLGNVKQLL